MQEESLGIDGCERFLRAGRCYPPYSTFQVCTSSWEVQATNNSYTQFTFCIFYLIYYMRQRWLGDTVAENSVVISSTNRFFDLRRIGFITNKTRNCAFLFFPPFFFFYIKMAALSQMQQPFSIHANHLGLLVSLANAPCPPAAAGAAGVPARVGVAVGFILRRGARTESSQSPRLPPQRLGSLRTQPGPFQMIQGPEWSGNFLNSTLVSV